MIDLNGACAIAPDAATLRHHIALEYERLAAAPEQEFHFHTGREYAINRLRYDAAQLDALPPENVRRFAGLGNPHRCGPIHEGETVLDVGCGAGMDLLLAADAVGTQGRVIGVDATPAMLEVARRGAFEAGALPRVELRLGRSDGLPLGDESVDVVISNGVINLAPDKQAAMHELRRVLKPGGRLYLADAMITGAFKQSELANPKLWAY